MTTNTTTATNAIARANNDLLAYLKGAEVGMAIVAKNMIWAANIDPQFLTVCDVVGTIRGLLGELIDDLVDRMDADQAVEDAIAMEAEEWLPEHTNEKFQADEAEKAKRVQEDLLPPSSGFELNVLWIGREDPTNEEIDQLVEGNLGAVSAKVDTVPPHYFEDSSGDFVEAAVNEACSWGHDLIAGDFSADQALQLGIAVAQNEELHGVRFAVRKDGGGFRIFMV